MEEALPAQKSSSKGSKKLSNFAQLLCRKKRIGCLLPNSRSCVPSVENDEECRRKIKDDDSLEIRNTNVSLCCAMTENSITPVPFRVVDKEKPLSDIEDKKSILMRLGSFKGKVNEMPLNGKAIDEAKLERTNSKINLDSCSSTPQSRSPESSPSPVPRVGLRTKFLLSRRSVDNIPTGLSSLDLEASPSSTRSHPTNGASFSLECNKKGKKKRRNQRPSSMVVLSRKNVDVLNPHPIEDASRTASMDSLARQSLLAAQVLHILPISKARERNFLCDRIAANSLLGKIELERALPLREVRIYVATWNMNGQAPPQGLNSLLLPEDISHVPDVVVVGTQESHPDKYNWEVTLQETLGPSHVLFQSSSFGTLHLAIFIRRDLIWFVSVADEATFSVRPGTAFRTKGAIAIAFYLFGTTFLFLTCHLTAHQDKVKERLQDIRRIVKYLELPNKLPCRHKNKDVTDNFDYVFWSGDLNFRLTRPRSEVLDWVSSKTFPLNEPAQCTPGDQLTDCIVNGSALKGFEEGPLTFAPTYKYDPGTQVFDTSNKQRTPSYTDRVLYKTRKHGALECAVDCLAYNSVPSVSTSDHKPVWGLFKCPVRPGTDTIPLNAGSFNREVYLEAIKRRAAAVGQCESTTSACSIQ